VRGGNGGARARRARRGQSIRCQGLGMERSAAWCVLEGFWGMEWMGRVIAGQIGRNAGARESSGESGVAGPENLTNSYTVRKYGLSQTFRPN
jgi:hypothetical protein